MMNFTPKIKVEVGYKSAIPFGYEYDRRHDTAIVKYSASLITRDWGFCVTMTCPDQTILLELEFVDQVTEETEYFLVEVKLENIETVISEERSLFGDIAPKEFEITLANIKKVGDKFQANGTGVLTF